MKKSVFALVAASALLFVACGGDSSNDSPATRAELCAASPKLTLGCLEGTWKLSKVAKYSKAGVETDPDPLSNVGSGLLSIDADGSFRYVANRDGRAFNGTLTISDDSTSIKFDKPYGDAEIPQITTKATVSETELLLDKSAIEEIANGDLFDYKDVFTFVPE